MYDYSLPLFNRRRRPRVKRPFLERRLLSASSTFETGVIYVMVNMSAVHNVRVDEHKEHVPCIVECQIDGAMR